MIPDDDRVEELRPNAPVFAVAPVRSRNRIPRGVLVGLVVAVMAFVGGVAVASSGPEGLPLPDREPAASGAGTAALDEGDGPASPGPGAAGTPVPSPTAALAPRPSLPPPGSSAFLADFRPGAVIASVPGGKACRAGEPLQKEVPRTRADGPRLTFQRSWMVWCPVTENRRQAFLLDVFEALVDVIPAQTFGYSAGGGGAGSALFPYAERPLAGKVSLTADAAGRGFAIAVVVEEWRLDATP